MLAVVNIVGGFLLGFAVCALLVRACLNPRREREAWKNAQLEALENYSDSTEQDALNARAESDQLRETGIVLQSHLSLLLSDTCTSKDRTRIRQEMGLIPEGEADRPEHRQEYCADCDGCGWVEGGSTLKTECATCKGAGVVLRELAPHGVIGRRET